MSPLLKPDNINVKTFDEFTAKVTLEPLERGFGHTLGYALRRILLSSLQGSAVTELEIEGVEHEFCSIDGVLEDVINIVLNFKTFSVLSTVQEEVWVDFEFNGPQSITVKDFNLPEAIVVSNPDHHIATITTEKTLRGRFLISNGRGYVPAVVRKKQLELEGEGVKIGRIYLDASFSPVSRVSYSVDQTRVDNRTDLDKLIIELSTNGTIKADDAIKNAATILVSQLGSFVNIDEAFEKKTTDTKSTIDSIMLTPIDRMDLTVRSTNCLKAENIHYVGDLVQKSENELLKTPNLGRKSLSEIKAMLDKHQLELGTVLNDWPPAELLEQS